MLILGNREQGFTLFEALVATALLGVLSLGVVAYVERLGMERRAIWGPSRGRPARMLPTTSERCAAQPAGRDCARWPSPRSKDPAGFTPGFP